MNLHPAPFESIRSGRKTIEMRLFDNRRKNIHVGDTIIFTQKDSGETLSAKVINLFVYRDFRELYARHDKISIGYNENDVASPDDMLIYYTEEEIKTYGALAIEILKI
jgi:ASC-1-like (ASCH) protein